MKITFGVAVCFGLATEVYTLLVLARLLLPDGTMHGFGWKPRLFLLPNDSIVATVVESGIP